MEQAKDTTASTEGKKITSNLNSNFYSAFYRAIAFACHQLLIQTPRALRHPCPTEVARAGITHGSPHVASLQSFLASGLAFLK